MSRAAVFSASVLVVLAQGSRARAQTTTYATPAELPQEGVPNLLDLALLGQYARVVDHDPAGLRDITTFDLRSRLYLEPEREQVMGDIERWLQTRAGAGE